MDSTTITIFFSWQSDLPGNKTRNIIQKGIDSATKLLRETVEIITDRDTQGEVGSPDIMQTIFSKIDNCDIFVADVSAITKIEVLDKEGNPTGKIKAMPNPNVMMELGYATNVLGTNRVICILNSEFGDKENMHFDVAHDYYISPKKFYEYTGIVVNGLDEE